LSAGSSLSWAQKFCDLTLDEDDHRRLEHVLLRIHTIVEEAEGRCITNQGMLLQLKMLMEGMYEGHYVLDRFMEEWLKLTKASTTMKVDATLYRSIVDGLRYLVQMMSDIAFAVGYVSRFMEIPERIIGPR